MVGGKEEAAVSAFIVLDGAPQCRVGFLPRREICRADLYDNRLVQVTELRSFSDLASERASSHRMGGVAKCTVIS